MKTSKEKYMDKLNLDIDNISKGIEIWSARVHGSKEDIYTCKTVGNCICSTCPIHSYDMTDSCTNGRLEDYHNNPNSTNLFRILNYLYIIKGWLIKSRRHYEKFSI